MPRLSARESHHVHEFIQIIGLQDTLHAKVSSVRGVPARQSHGGSTALALLLVQNSHIQMKAQVDYSCSNGFIASFCRMSRTAALASCRSFCISQ